MVHWINAQVRGYVKDVSDDQELVRGNQVRGGYYFLYVDYFMLNNEKVKGKMKVYISTENLGMGRSKGIVYYPTNDLKKKDLEFLTAIVDPRKSFLHQMVGFIGKMRKSAGDENFNHFMTHLTKVKIFPDPKTYLKKS
jgi:hypothetical protein